MHSYYNGLHFLKKLLVIGEAITLFIRLVFQVLFTLPSTFLVMQVMLASIIYCRKHCEPQAQVYILINFVIIYAIVYNEFFQYFYSKSQQNPLVQNFNNNYKIWGYVYQSVFRIFSMIIAWRCYQYSKLLPYEEDDDDQIDI